MAARNRKAALRFSGTSGELLILQPNSGSQSYNRLNIIQVDIGQSRVG